jgi:hypothetical protein
MNATVIALLGLSLFSPTLAHAEDVFRIEIGREDSRRRPKGPSNEDLQQRIWQLERAVDQLQRKVFQLSMEQPRPAPTVTVVPATTTTCILKAEIGGTFTSTQTSEGAARAQVLKDCADKTNDSIFCEERRVKCSK